MSSPEMFYSVLSKAVESTSKFVSKQSKIYFSDITVKDLSTKFDKIVIEEKEFNFLLQESKKKNVNTKFQGFQKSEHISPMFDPDFESLYKKLELFFNSHSSNAYVIGMHFPGDQEYVFPTDAYKCLYPRIGNSDLYSNDENLNKKDAQIFELRVNSGYIAIEVLTSSEKLLRELNDFRSIKYYYEQFQKDITKPKIVLRKWYDFNVSDVFKIELKAFGWNLFYKYYHQQRKRDIEKHNKDFERFVNYIHNEEGFKRPLGLEVVKTNDLKFYILKKYYTELPHYY